MTFEGMFEAGACLIQAFTKGDATVAWSGTLGLNQSSPEFVDGSGTTWMVSVDGSGNVTLEIDSTAVSSGFGGKVVVLPQYDVSALQTQVAAINSKYAGSYGGGSTSCDGGLPTSLAFDAETGAATPSSVLFAAHAPNPASSVQVTTNGAV
jgi:hypothetical protein